MKVKSTKVGSLNIPEKDQYTNPDTSRWLWVVLAVYTQDRAVQNAKDRKKETYQIKGMETIKKYVAVKAKSYTQIIEIIRSHDDLIKTVL